jgi:hypothetical protein
LGLLLCAPALGNGLQTEDWLHRATASFAPWSAALYSAGRASRAATYHATDAGILPWIASEDLHVAFFRPLGSLSLHVDYRLWPARPELMYAHGLMWLGVLTGSAAWLYHRVIKPGWVAGLAAVLYALDDAHGLAVGWLAARHALIACALGLLALALHDCWRRSGWKLGAVLAPVALLVALFAGELAVGVVGYLVAHALFLDPLPWRARWRAALGWGVALALWFTAYLRSGAGAYGSGVYLHPTNEPLVFLGALWQRLPVLLLGAIGAPWSDVWLVTAEDRRSILVWGAIGFLVLVGLLSLRLVRRSAEARFWIAGMLLSAVPACTAPWWRCSCKRRLRRATWHPLHGAGESLRWDSRARGSCCTGSSHRSRCRFVRLRCEATIAHFSKPRTRSSSGFAPPSSTS